MTDEDTNTKLLAELVEEFALLSLNLEEAQNAYQGADDNGRSGTILALGAVNIFLRNSKLKKRHELAAPLMSLQMALIDLGDGITPPLLQAVQKNPGREVASTMRDAMMQYSAATLELLIRTGMKVEDAARLVVRPLTARGMQLPFRIASQPPTHTTVINWRKRYRNADSAIYYRSRVADEIVTTDMKRARADILKKFDNILKNYVIGS